MQHDYKSFPTSSALVRSHQFWSCTKSNKRGTTTHLVREQGVEASRGPAEAREGPDDVGPVRLAVVTGPACHVSRNGVQQLSWMVQQRSTRPCNR